MATIQGYLKKTVSKKFREFQKNGLEKYGKHLEQQLKIASKSESKAAYKRYIEKEIINTNKKLEPLKNKLKAWTPANS